MQPGKAVGPGPISLEAERRKVMATVYNVEKDLRLFKEKWLKTTIDDRSEKLLDYVKIITKSLAVKNIGNWRVFQTCLEEYERQYIHHREPEVEQLKEICVRGQAFNSLISDLSTRLHLLYENHMSKYFLSFLAEADQHGTKSPQAYENRINKLREGISKGFEALRRAGDRLEEEGPNFQEYLRNYGMVLHLMDQIRETYLRVCEPIKRWVAADEAYPARLRDEMFRLGRRKMEIAEAIRRRRRCAEDAGRRMQRQNYQTKKQQKQLQRALEKKRLCRMREAAVRENLNRIEADLSRKGADLDEVQQRFANRKSNSPQLFDKLVVFMDALECEIEDMRLKRDTAKCDMNRVLKDKQEADKAIHQVRGQYEAGLKAERLICDTVNEHGCDIKRLHDEQKAVSRMIDSLRKIREIKLHPETVKRIHAFGYTPGEMSLVDPLLEAFRVTAADIGKDWIFLYQKLPFVPPRDFTARTHDVEIIDLSSRHTETHFQDLAMKSLEKWKRLSTNVSTDALINTLKKLKKFNVVKKIEHQLLLSS